MVLRLSDGVYIYILACVDRRHHHHNQTYKCRWWWWWQPQPASGRRPTTKMPHRCRSMSNCMCNCYNFHGSNGFWCACGDGMTGWWAATPNKQKNTSLSLSLARGWLTLNNSVAINRKYTNQDSGYFDQFHTSNVAAFLSRFTPEPVDLNLLHIVTDEFVCFFSPAVSAVKLFMTIFI